MRGRVPFSAGGKDYSLRFGTNAMARYQEITATLPDGDPAKGETVMAALRRIEKDSDDIALLRRLFWVSVEQDCTEAEAGDLMDEIGLQDRAGPLLGEAIKAAFPAAAGKTDDPRKAPATS